MNVNLLKAKIIEKGFGVIEFCKKIGMSKSRFYRALTSDDGFSVREVRNIVVALNLNEQETYNIFFVNQVA